MKKTRYLDSRLGSPGTAENKGEDTNWSSSYLHAEQPIGFLVLMRADSQGPLNMEEGDGEIKINKQTIKKINHGKQAQFRDQKYTLKNIHSF